MNYRASKPYVVGKCICCIFHNINSEKGNCSNPDSLTYNCCPNARHTYIFKLVNIKLSTNIKIL